MKVLLANKFFYDHGGPETVLFAERDLLRDAGHDVIDFAMADERNRPTQYAQYFAPNVDLQTIRPAPASLRNAWRFLDSGEAASRMRRLVRDNRPDIAHLHSINHQLTPSIVRVLRDEKVPVVMTLHDYKLVCPAYTLLANGRICEKCSGGAFYRATTSNCRGRARSPLLTAESYMQHRLRRSYRGVSLFLSPSRFLADKFRQMGFRHQIEVLQNPLPCDVAEHDTPREDHVLFVGRAAPEKGLRTLCAASIRSGVHVRIAGDGPQLDDLRRDFGTAPTVRFLGRIPPDHAHDEMRRSRAVVVPSEWYENQPMVILEAFAQGTPVIASDLGGNPELVLADETGLLFPPGDVAALAAALKRAIANPDEMSGMGGRARQFARDFTPENHLARLLDVYGRVLGAAPAPRPSPSVAVAEEPK